MCGRLSQYRGIYDFVAALTMPNALANIVGDQPIDRYNVAPTTQIALLHQEGEVLNADLVRWGDLTGRPKSRRRSTPRSRRLRTSLLPCDLATSSHYADRQLVRVGKNEGAPKKQPYLIRRRVGAPILCAAIGQYQTGDRERYFRLTEHLQRVSCCWSSPSGNDPKRT